MIVFGVPVGYSGVNTLTDSSTMVKRGHKGDATVLRPTLIAAVPLVLERIYKVKTTFCNDPSLGKFFMAYQETRNVFGCFPRISV